MRMLQQTQRNNRPVLSQMEQLIEKSTIKVVIENNRAYWVHDNSIYEAKVTEDGRIDAENAEKIDVFSLSKKETDRLMSILDSISER